MPEAESSDYAAAFFVAIDVLGVGPFADADFVRTSLASLSVGLAYPEVLLEKIVLSIK